MHALSRKGHMRTGKKQVSASQDNLPWNEWVGILTLEVPASRAVEVDIFLQSFCLWYFLTQADWESVFT